MDALNSITVIPHWIAHTLMRRRLPMSTVLDYSALSQVVTATDLAQLCAANDEASFATLGIGGLNTWPWLVKMWKMDESQAIHFRNQVAPLINLPITEEALKNRLYSEDALEERFDTPFITYDLGRGHVGVVIHPGYFIANTIASDEKAAYQFSLLRALLCALYATAPMHLVARSMLFLRYLGLLSKKRIILN